MSDFEYRKKPVVIEAFQMTEERRMDDSNWPVWLQDAWERGHNQPGELFRKELSAKLPDILCIRTLEGVHTVSWNDWIIKGVHGELYPCKPEIFSKTYEKVINE